MLFSPLASRKAFGFSQCRVNVNGCQNFVKVNSVLHGQYIFGNQIAGMCADDSNSQNLICIGFGQDFDTSVIFGVGYGAIQVINTIGSHFVVNA